MLSAEPHLAKVFYQRLHLGNKHTRHRVVLENGVDAEIRRVQHRLDPVVEPRGLVNWHFRAVLVGQLLWRILAQRLKVNGLLSACLEKKVPFRVSHGDEVVSAAV